MTSDYTPRQGQYLAFIYYYTKIHGGQRCAVVDSERSDYSRMIVLASVRGRGPVSDQSRGMGGKPGAEHDWGVTSLAEEGPDRTQLADDYEIEGSFPIESQVGDGG